MKLNKDNLVVCEVCSGDKTIFSEENGIVCMKCHLDSELLAHNKRIKLTQEDLTPF